MVSVQSVLLALLISPCVGYKIGIIGGGTVGGGIAQILTKKGQVMRDMTGKDLEITKICVRSLDKKRDFDLPEGCVLTTDMKDVVEDPDIDLVVEVAGGTDEARAAVYDSIKGGKDVVTANKALIAAYLGEMNDLLKDSTSQFGFEASVMGGIPIIHTLQNDFVGDEIFGLQGIMNGCTNFMLTKMNTEGCDYDTVLAEAQRLGYAEADPSLDVGGNDARSKLRILMTLALGVDVPEDDIPLKGITEVQDVDFAYAKQMGGTIKLLAVAKLGTDGKSVTAMVSPAFVPESSTLASVNGAMNCVEILSENLGATFLVGQGAGRLPTANSCINDIVRCATGSSPGPRAFSSGRSPSAKDLVFDADYESEFYMRCTYDDTIGITRFLGEICEKHKVSIFSMLQLPEVDSFVVLTDKIKSSAMQSVVDDLSSAPWVRGEPFWMPVVKD